ncbi:MAG: LysR substrate-binding domain-containing protein [Solirubrobacteraceae bacterium MAG38_C4-C5]|nr:LysR substrate-binding domain-containing protein [Candidatus Siliceabacter maunaloa]
MLDLKRLAVLCEVGARGSLAAAAKALSYTPSAVSQQMTALSRDIGVALFERTPRGMRLTDSAHALIAHCEAVFDRLAQAQAELEAIAGGVAGRVRLGSFPTATVAFTAEAIERFRGLHPGVDLRFADGEPYESVVRLKERELDIAVIFDFDHWTAATDYDGASVCADCDIECVELFDDPFHVVMPRDHPLARREQVELPDLADERVLGAPSSCSPWGADLQRLCLAAGFQPSFESCYRTADFAALQAIVATGRGITLVPGLALISAHPGTVVRPLRGGGLVRHVRLATLAGVAHSPVVDAMAKVLLETARAQVAGSHAHPSSNLTVS